jgi:hypothetical protein
MRFLKKLINNGLIDINTAFVNIVNGVIILSVNEICGTNAAKTIIANASAPPKRPILQIIIATGATINEIPIVIRLSDKFGSKISKIAAIAPKTIQT